MRSIDINNAGPIAEGMIRRRYLFIYSMVNVNRNIIEYNKYLLVITVVAVFVNY